MKKEKRHSSHSMSPLTDRDMTDRGHQTEESSTQSQPHSRPALDQEIETILDPNWAWRLLHKP